MTAKVSVQVSGPFFQRDPAKTLRENIRLMMSAIAKEGAEDVIARLQSGAGSRAPISALGDRVSDHVRGRVESLSGKDWAATAVISVNNSGLSSRGGMSLMAAASIVEGRVHAFRQATTRLRNSRAANRAELTKGLE